MTEGRWKCFRCNLTFKDENIANNFSLKQNYPNPFNPSTNISFTIPQSGNVKLTLFDAIGNQIENLFEGNLSEGEHQITFNSNARLSSGIYYYKIVFNNDSKVFTQTKKMILLQ